NPRLLGGNGGRVTGDFFVRGGKRANLVSQDGTEGAARSGGDALQHEFGLGLSVHRVICAVCRRGEVVATLRLALLGLRTPTLGDHQQGLGGLSGVPTPGWGSIPLLGLPTERATRVSRTGIKVKGPNDPCAVFSRWGGARG